MVAYQEGHVLTRPISDAWTIKRELNPAILELAQKLAV
jgi:hypothetical protein